MLRGSSLVLLLLLSAGPAFAMDQSATEETNCLQACDANQEHCATNASTPSPRNYSPVRLSSSAPARSPLAIRSRGAIQGR